MQRFTRHSLRARCAYYSERCATIWRALLLLTAGFAWLVPQQAWSDEATIKTRVLSEGSKVQDATIVKGTFNPQETGKPSQTLTSGTLTSGDITDALVMKGTFEANAASGVSAANATLSQATIKNAAVSGVGGVGTLSDAELVGATVENATFEKLALVLPDDCDNKTIQLIDPNKLDAGTVTRLREIMNSCIQHFPSMTQVEITKATADMKAALAGINMKIQFGDNPSNLRDLSNARVALESGLNVFNKLVEGWQDTLEYYFYLGYQGTSVDNIKNKGSSRVGLYIYNQYESVVKECPPKDKNDKNDKNDKCGFKFWVFPHLYGNVYQTSSGENSAVTGNAAGGAAAQTQVVTSVEANIGGFWPAYTMRQQAYNNDEGILATGVIWEHGWKFNTNLPYSIPRTYMGLRSAFSQNIYLDLMWGKTAGLPGRRFELRGQMPVYEFPIGQVYLGGVLNIDKSGLAPNTDADQIYVIYRAAFGDVFGKQDSTGKQ